MICVIDLTTRICLLITNIFLRAIKIKNMNYTNKSTLFFKLWRKEEMQISLEQIKKAWTVIPSCLSLRIVEMEQITVPSFVNISDAVESTWGPGLGTSANIPMFSSYGNFVLTTICPPTFSKQQLVDYQKVRKVFLDHSFQESVGIFRGKPSKGEELSQVTNLLNTLGIRGIRSPD